MTFQPFSKPRLRLRIRLHAQLSKQPRGQASLSRSRSRGFEKGHRLNFGHGASRPFNPHGLNIQEEMSMINNFLIYPSPFLTDVSHFSLLSIINLVFLFLSTYFFLMCFSISCGQTSPFTIITPFVSLSFFIPFF